MHRLALAFGRRVPELEREMGSREITRWQAIDRLFGIGVRRDAALTALIVSKIHNANCAKRKDMVKPEHVFEWIIGQYLPRDLGGLRLRPDGPDSEEDAASEQTARRQLSQLGMTFSAGKD